MDRAGRRRRARAHPAGQPRAGVEVFRGDPEQVAAVADSLEFEHKYRSAVIAWSPEDRPTDAQIEVTC